MLEQKYCKFTDLSKTGSPPFIVYADVESVWAPSDTYEHIHLPVSASLLLLRPSGQTEYQEFTGPECIVDFLSALEYIANRSSFVMV